MGGALRHEAMKEGRWVPKPIVDGQYRNADRLRPAEFDVAARYWDIEESRMIVGCRRIAACQVDEFTRPGQGFTVLAVFPVA